MKNKCKKCGDTFQIDSDEKNIKCPSSGKESYNLKCKENESDFGAQEAINVEARHGCGFQGLYNRYFK